MKTFSPCKSYSYSPSCGKRRRAHPRTTTKTSSSSSSSSSSLPLLLLQVSLLMFGFMWRSTTNVNVNVAKPRGRVSSLLVHAVKPPISTIRRTRTTATATATAFVSTTTTTTTPTVAAAAFATTTQYSHGPLNALRQRSLSSQPIYPPMLHVTSPSLGLRFRIMNTARYASSSPSSSSSSSSFDIGDTVEFSQEKEGDLFILQGTVTEKNGGWYTVMDAYKEVHKKRAKQLSKPIHSDDIKDDNVNVNVSSTPETNKKVDIPPSLSTVTATTTATIPDSSTSTSTPVPPPSTMLDLDALLATNPFDSALTSDTQTLLSQAHYITQNYHKWVMFTDLHCSPSTLSTTCQILKEIHNIASSLPHTGILFLGDFWHHRGSLPIPTLNTVLDILSNFHVPMIMIPGNHDQVTFRGEQHGLSALRNAYFLSNEHNNNNNNSNNNNINNDSDSNSGRLLPGPLIFSQPTQFLKASFIPHIRDHGVMESILSSSIVTSPQNQALFIHADVTGAYMNDLIQSQGGVSPRMFPPSKLIYSGHFHKPHVIVNQKHDVTIEYVGSPYEVSLSEAGQPKVIQILDSNQGWKCVEKIPFQMGPKHYKCFNVADLLQVGSGPNNDSTTIGPLSSPSPSSPTSQHDNNNNNNGIKKGDRIVLTLSDHELERLSSHHRTQNEEEDAAHADAIIEGLSMEQKLKELRDLGAKVEIRTVKHTAPSSSSNIKEESGIIPMEDMTPESTLQSFLQSEFEKENITKEKMMELIKVGLNLLQVLVTPAIDTEDNENGDNLENGDEQTSSSSPSSSSSDPSTISTQTDLTFTSIAVQGFGCFKEYTEYPLDQRGLVLIRGKNKDGGSDSNGSGKSTLAMSTLWALTGTMDARPVQDGKVVDVVHDDSKVTKVTLKGYCNQEPFTITRTKTSTNKSTLTFLLNEEDLTRQSVKETQAVIDEYLSTNNNNGGSNKSTSPQILTRTIFHGQHDLNGLLEATDAQWKEELALVVPLDIWKDGSSLARKKARQSKSQVSEYDGMIQIRSKDWKGLQEKCDQANLVCNQHYFTLQQRTKAIDSEMKEAESKMSNTNIHENDLSEAQHKMQHTAEQLTDLESKRQDILSERAQVLAPLCSEYENIQQKYNDLQRDVEWGKRELSQEQNNVLVAETLYQKVQSKWSQLNGDSTDDNEMTLAACPTCHRPFDEGDHQHSYEAVQNTMQDEISSAMEALMQAQEALESATYAYEMKEKTSIEFETRYNRIRKLYQNTKETWDDQVSHTDLELNQIRQQQTQLATQVSEMANLLKQRNEIQSIKSSYETELQKLENMYSSSKETYDSLSWELEKIKTQVQLLEEQRDSAQYKSKLYSQLTDIFGPRGIQTFVLQDAIHSLEVSSQTYLDELSDKSQRLELVLDKSDRIVRKASIRTIHDGTFQERPLSSLSGGQWRRCSLALSFGFSELVARRGGLRSSLLVLDEPLTHLDHSGREQVGSLLRRLVRSGEEGLLGLKFSTILVILQDLAAEELGEETFDFVDEVIKMDGTSSVRLDDGIQ